MGRIRILPDRVANQIAAGEVVERPASVCKELLENSLDAGATQIQIELHAGGRSLIQVSDNGSGMSRDDAMLAFERHATSKLRQADDLLAIATLGFRGEALPAIASVSRLTLRTCAAGDGSGTAVEIQGGRLKEVRDEAAAPGTTVTARSLFYNVPARRKFLRTEKTELGHALRTATHYSLAHLDKSFQLRNEHGTLLGVTPVKTLRERVYQVFGGDALDRLVELPPGEGGASAGSLRLAGFVSEPQSQRSNRNSTYTFVNRRLVRDPLMQRAISAAYVNLMPNGAYPMALLFLELPPEEVDVNVHPAKTEVRFRNPSAVFEFVRETVRERLVESKPAASLPHPTATAGHALPPQAPAGGGCPGPTPSVGQGARRPERRPGRLAFPRGPAPAAGTTQDSAQREPALSRPANPAADGTAAVDGHSRSPLVERGPSNLGRIGGLDLLGQLHDSFIVAAGDDGIWIIDQHVAHERILFEQVLAARLHGKPPMQALLTPIVLTLTPDRMLAYDELSEEFRGNGFEIEPYGGRTVAVTATPMELAAQDVETLMLEILDHAGDGGPAPSLGDVRKRMAATIACHAAIKVNMPLTTEKMRWLLEELARSDCPMSCPHGRPIALKYGMRDILKAFHRI